MRDLIPIVDNETNPWMRRLLKGEALRCPECGSAQSMLHILSEDRLIAPRYVVACRECFYQAAFGKDVVGAIKQWNRIKADGLREWLKDMLKSQKRYRKKRLAF